jgi:hypothetical protein
MAPEVAELYMPLRDGLQQLCEMGKRGRKNKDGLLLGRPLPWAARSTDTGGPRIEGLAERLRCLFVNTCHHALERRLLDPHALSLALASLFGWEHDLATALAPLGIDEAAAVLEAAFDETGRLYFVPADRLRHPTATRRWPATPTLV